MWIALRSGSDYFFCKIKWFKMEKILNNWKKPIFNFVLGKKIQKISGYWQTIHRLGMIFV